MEWSNFVTSSSKSLVLLVALTNALYINSDWLSSSICKSAKVECTYEVDESLLAGIKVKVKDQVMDNSAINRLNKMKDSIMG